MAKASGSLFHEVAFDQREETGGDGAGNIEGDWVERFRCRAEFIQLRGGEAVLSEHSVLITAGWQARDTRRGTAFNIRDIEFEENRQFISLTCESGVATG
jgi:hypothetical protein